MRVAMKIVLGIGMISIACFFAGIYLGQMDIRFNAPRHGWWVLASMTTREQLSVLWAYLVQCSLLLQVPFSAPYI